MKVGPFIPPPAVAKEAKKGLEMRRKFGRGGTVVGLARGRQLAGRRKVTPEVILRMYSYFSRHYIDTQGKNFGNDEKPSNGYIAWLLWGGDAGASWALNVRTMIRNERKSK